MTSWRKKLAAIALSLQLVALTAEAGRRRAPDLVFEDVNPRSATHGQPVELKRIWAGRGAVLQFIASWCAPCREELPHVQALAASGAPVVLVASDEGAAGTANVLIVAERAGVTVPILFVPPQAVEALERDWRHELLPATYFIDAKGRVRAVHEGPLEPDALAREAAAVILPGPG